MRSMTCGTAVKNEKKYKKRVPQAPRGVTLRRHAKRDSRRVHEKKKNKTGAAGAMCCRRLAPQALCAAGALRCRHFAPQAPCAVGVLRLAPRSGISRRTAAPCGVMQCVTRGTAAKKKQKKNRRYRRPALRRGA